MPATAPLASANRPVAIGSREWHGINSLPIP